MPDEADLSGRRSQSGDHRLGFPDFLLLGVAGKRTFSFAQIGKKAEAVEHAPDHCLKVRLLILAKEIGEIGDVVVPPAFDPLAKAVIIEPRAPAVPKLENCKWAYQLPVELPARQLREVMQVADLRTLARRADFSAMASSNASEGIAAGLNPSSPK
jgi:hypothetical protein